MGNFFEKGSDDLSMNIYLTPNHRIHEGSINYDSINPELIIDGQSMGCLKSLNLETIKSLAKPSTYAKHDYDNRIYDPNVRQASEIDGSRIQFDFPRPSELDEMVPSGYTLSTKLLKLAVYQPGDFFTAHIDGSRAPNHVGTLLVSLPSQHTGGNLLIRRKNGSDEKSGDNHVWKTEEREGESNCKWVAFALNVFHEVERLKTGTRMVLQYQLMIDKIPDKSTKDKTPDHEVSKKTKQVEELFAKDNNLEYVGLILNTRYDLVGFNPSNLTETDSLIYAQLARGYRTYLKYLKLDFDEANSKNYQKDNEAQVTVYLNQIHDLEPSRNIDKMKKKACLVFPSQPKKTVMYPSLFVERKPPVERPPSPKRNWGPPVRRHNCNLD